MSFIAELKRRNVFRVGIAYGVGAWLLAQVADLVLDVLGAPAIVLRSLAALLALGFVPVVIFAWAFEMTPEGVKKESEVDRTRSITGHTARKLDLVTIGLVIAAVAFVIVERYLPEKKGPDTVSQTEALSESGVIEEKLYPAPFTDHPSVAVLPFANRSNQDDDLFFTDGIHDDLLTQLAKIHGLRVISRTSVMEYRDTTKNLREIGAELQVATIVEGGIQKVGNRVRVNAQLIEVETDRHLWAETFDRELTAENIFDIQSEIARKIVNAVSIQLTPEEEQRLAEIPTQNLAAYEAYLHAREVYFGANYSRTRETGAQPWLEQAIALDPGYVEAHAMLAGIYGQQYWRGVDTSDELLAEYRAILDKGRELSPRAPSVLRAMANYHYRVENDYRKSLQLLTQALEQAPGNVDVHGDLGITQRRLGRWQESIASFRRARELDPANRFYHALMLETMDAVSDWQGIIDNSVPLQDADPKDLDIQLLRARAQFNMSGNFTPIDRALQKMQLDATSTYTQLSAWAHWLRRDADAVIATLNTAVWMEAAKEPDQHVSRLYQLANAYRLKGDGDKATEQYEAIIGERDLVLSSALQVQAYGGMTIALSQARLGRHAEAAELAARLMHDIPQERDSMLTVWLLSSQAMIKGLAGNQQGAIEELELALQTPGSNRITAWDLHLDPNWDFMRDNPRFVALATPANVVHNESE